MLYGSAAAQEQGVPVQAISVGGMGGRPRTEEEIIAEKRARMREQEAEEMRRKEQEKREKNPWEAMLNPPRQNVGRPGNIMEMMVGDRRQSVGIASQLASAGLNDAIPGMATQNHLINKAVGVAAKVGSMNVPFM